MRLTHLLMCYACFKCMDAVNMPFIFSSKNQSRGYFVIRHTLQDVKILDVNLLANDVLLRISS